MSRPRVLVAGVGNIFLGDDAFGVEVVQRLARRPLPDGVRVVDFGIRGFDLTYALLDGYEAVILVDAAPRGGRPGTLYVIEPELDDGGEPPATGLMIDPHNLDPARVLRLASRTTLCRGIGEVDCDPLGPSVASLKEMSRRNGPALACFIACPFGPALANSSDALLGRI